MSGDDMKHSEPNSEIFLKAVEWYAPSPTQLTAIEGSTNGVKAVKSVGIHCIGF